MNEKIMREKDREVIAGLINSNTVTVERMDVLFRSD